MRIIKKEILEFSEKETEAIQLVTQICTGLMRGASDPNLKKLAEETYDCITTLWGWGEQKDGDYSPSFFCVFCQKNFFKKVLTNAATCGIIEVGKIGPATDVRARIPDPYPHMQIFSYFQRLSYAPGFSRKWLGPIGTHMLSLSVSTSSYCQVQFQLTVAS